MDLILIYRKNEVRDYDKSPAYLLFCSPDGLVVEHSSLDWNDGVQFPLESFFKEKNIERFRLITANKLFKMCKEIKYTQDIP